METIGRELFEEKLRDRMAPKKIQLVMLAYRLSKYGHRGQKRDNGERYFEHPKRVALILMDELEIYDSDMLITAFLHDIEEDSFILEWPDIELIFGKAVLEMVKTVTKEQSEEDKEYVRKVRRTAKKTRIVKLADRLDNLRSLESCSPQKQRKIIRETEKYYISLARRTNRYLFEKIQEICQAWQNRI